MGNIALKIITWDALELPRDWDLRTSTLKKVEALNTRRTVGGQADMWIFRGGEGGGKGVYNEFVFPPLPGCSSFSLFFLCVLAFLFQLGD